VEFDPEQVSYADLLKIFWTSHDPSRRVRSTQYMPACFTLGAEQAATAAASVAAVTEAMGAKPKTVVRPASTFFVAEDYHQKYRLRHKEDLRAEVGLTTDMQLLESPLAAKLNGFVAGYGDVATVNAVCEQYGVPDSIREALLRRASAEPRVVGDYAQLGGAAAAGGSSSGSGCAIQ